MFLVPFAFVACLSGCGGSIRCQFDFDCAANQVCVVDFGVCIDAPTDGGALTKPEEDAGVAPPPESIAPERIDLEPLARELTLIVPAEPLDSGRVVVETPDAGLPDGGMLARCTPGEVCRAAAGGCDLEEVCSPQGFCPADTLKAADAICRPALGVCDLPERCTGTSSGCPTDRLRPAGETCGTASCIGGAATPAATCTGGSVDCSMPAASSCGLYRCDQQGVACRTSCSVNDPCAPGAVCCAPGFQCDTPNICVPLKVNGEGCSHPAECASSSCVDVYLDQDGDGFGRELLGKQCGGPTRSDVTTKGGDCCDLDHRVHPGQTGFFSFASACGGFDFDCNGSTIADDASPEGITCASPVCGAGSCSPGTGWQTTRPACGSSGTYKSCTGSTRVCGVMGQTSIACYNVQTTTKLVSCR